MFFAHFLQAFFDCSTVLVPRHSIFPFEKTLTLAFGSFISIINAENLFGLYVTFLACKAIILKFNLQFKCAVLTKFVMVGIITILFKVIPFVVFFVSTVFPGISSLLAFSLFSTVFVFCLIFIFNCGVSPSLFDLFENPDYQALEHC